MTLVNQQPPHFFIQHRGVAEGKVGRLFHEVIQEQYDRLERGKPAMYLVDLEVAPNMVVMSRLFEGGAVTTVTIVSGPMAEIDAYVEWGEYGGTETKQGA